MCIINLWAHFKTVSVMVKLKERFLKKNWGVEDLDMIQYLFQ